MVRRVAPIQRGYDNPALTCDDGGIMLRQLERLNSNPDSQPSTGVSSAAASQSDTAQTTPAATVVPQEDARYGAVNGVSEAKPKSPWSLPEVALNRVRDRAIGFVRHGSSKRFHQPVASGTRRVRVGGHGLHVARVDDASDAAAAAAFPDNAINTAKYTLLTFLPKNLFEQFRRVANFYFLCIALIQSIIDSPVSPMTSLLPLGFVVGVTLLKQGYEDWLRHKMDDEVNNKPACVVRYATLREVKTRHIAVGDVVCVRQNEELPCDLVLLSTSDKHGECHIQTTNLDGETNLKTKSSPTQTQALRTPLQLSTVRAEIECENPRPDLYRFVGAMTFQQPGGGRETIALGPQQVLLRGSRLKNTDTVYGCAIYTGRDTKLALNLKITRNKFSSVEKSMNKYLLFYLLLLLAEVLVATLLSFVYNPTRPDKNSPNGAVTLVQGYYWYLDVGDDSFETLNTLLSFLVIFNYIIPISLYVTVEMVKFVGTRFIDWDNHLVHNGIKAKANTSDLNEELGQVQYLFSDKTGTLTENEMRFQHCSVAGRAYREEAGCLRRHEPGLTPGQARQARQQAPAPAPGPPPISDEMERAELDGFLTALALCHTVQVHIPTQDTPEPNADNRSASSGSSTGRSESLPTSSGSSATSAGISATQSESSATTQDAAAPVVEYQANSPDEKALVEACRRFGVVFGGIEDDICKLTIRGRERLFRRLFVLEFDSERRRMSVVVEDDRGRVLLLCKGADSAIFGQCVAGELERTTEHVDYYAMLGLRTLVFAWRELSRPQLEHFSQRLRRARAALQNREAAVRRVNTLMESEMEVLGATGVEDKLQEGVPETLETLRAAGVKVWVLTGDKIETAINIATSCGHLKRGTSLLHLVRVSSPPELKKMLMEMDALTQLEQFSHFGLVLDGETLQMALRVSTSRHQLLRVATRCQAVLCCRMSPMQKAEVVKLVKYSSARPITAAVGDGANDVSMIQEAHVGFGLEGREGRQAARCSDFSLGRFRFLQRLLLVHGHWYYVRLANLVQYCFYKNVAFITPQVFFSACNLFSTTSLYDGFFLTFYNIFFVAAPPLAYGILEQDLPASTLRARPDIYRRFSRNVLLSWPQFVKWTLLGLWHASVAFFLVWYTWRADPIFHYTGHMTGLYAFGTVICQIIVIVVNIKMVLMSRYMTWIFFLFLFGGLVMMALTSVYSIINVSFIRNDDMRGVYEMVAVSGHLWLLQLLLVVVCLLPDLLIEVARAHGRGLNSCVDRLRLLLGFPASTASVFPAFSRGADGSVASLADVAAVTDTV